MSKKRNFANKNISSISMKKVMSALIVPIALISCNNNKSNENSDPKMNLSNVSDLPDGVTVNDSMSQEDVQNLVKELAKKCSNAPQQQPATTTIDLRSVAAGLPDGVTATDLNAMDQTAVENLVKELVTKCNKPAQQQQPATKINLSGVTLPNGVTALTNPNAVDEAAVQNLVQQLITKCNKQPAQQQQPATTTIDLSSVTGLPAGVTSTNSGKMSAEDVKKLVEDLVTKYNDAVTKAQLPAVMDLTAVKDSLPADTKGLTNNSMDQSAVIKLLTGLVNKFSAVQQPLTFNLTSVYGIPDDLKNKVTDKMSEQDVEDLVNEMNFKVLNPKIDLSSIVESFPAKFRSDFKDPLEKVNFTSNLENMINELKNKTTDNNWWESGNEEKDAE